MPLHPGHGGRVCGTPKDKFLKICEMIASTAEPGVHDDDVRAGLDPAQHGNGDDPHGAMSSCCWATSGLRAAA